MAWDKTVPTNTTIISSSPAQFVANWTGIDSFVKQNHYAIDAATIHHSAGECSVLLVAPTTILQALTPVPCAIGWDTTLQDMITWNATTSATTYTNRGGFVPSGTLMLFYQDTAPTGWTINNTLDDKLVYITKGSGAGGEIGGTYHTIGSWGISGFGGAADSHTLTIAELAAHTHSSITSHHENTIAKVVEDGTLYPVINNPTTSTGSAGGGEGHTHNVSSLLTVPGEMGTQYYTGATGAYKDTSASASDIDGIYHDVALVGSNTPPWDYIYVGAYSKFTTINFIVGAASANTISTLSADYCSGYSRTTVARKRSSNTAWLTASSAHGYTIGETVVITNVGGEGYNGTVAVSSVPTTASFTYICAGSNEAYTADPYGTITKYIWKGIGVTDNTKGGSNKPFSQSGTIVLASAPSDWTTDPVCASNNLYWARLSVDTTIAGSANGDQIWPTYASMVTPSWRPPGYCCIICQKD